MTKASAAELLDLIIERAPKLRAAGVLAVELDDVGFQLAPEQGEPDLNMGDEDEDDDEGINPLYDASTYGRPRHRGVPADRKRERSK